MPRQLVIEENVIKMCRCCWKEEDVWQRYPMLKGKLEISHGLCNTHFHAMLIQALEITAIYAGSTNHARMDTTKRC